jgi:curli biogenesis system outer membrane secretion channel CsgG
MMVIMGALFCFLVSMVTVASAAPKRIGVTKFETNGLTVHVRGGGYYDIGLGASDMLATELAKNKNFQVLEREQIKSVLEEQAFDASGAVDDSTAAEMGKIAGLKYLVYGKIVSAGAQTNNTSIMGISYNQLNIKVQIAVRMIDAVTGTIVWAEQVDGVVKKSGGGIDGIGSVDTGVSASVYDEALGIAIKKIANQINQQAPTIGSVVKVSGRKVYLDLGMDQGAQAGQRYAIYREGDPITNSAGEVIGVDKTDVCTVKIVSVDGQMSIAEIDGKTAAYIKEGDRARKI